MLASFMEVWKKIKEFPNYEASNLGSIRGKRGIIKPYKFRNGYLYLSLYRNGKGFTKCVHRLIMTTFKPINKKLTVNHIDGVKHHNNLDNLEWLTMGENRKHAFRTGLLKRPPKTHSLIAIMASRKKVVRNDGKVYSSMTEAALDIGSCEESVSKCCSGVLKHTGGYSFKLLK